MSVLDIAKIRSSVRSYRQQAVEENKLKEILEIAHVAPTAANMQPVRLVVVQREGAISELQYVIEHHSEEEMAVYRKNNKYDTRCQVICAIIKIQN